MNHDISHCNLDTCEKIDTCARYIAHLELKHNYDKFKDGLYSYFSNPEKSCIQQEYKYYATMVRH